MKALRKRGKFTENIRTKHTCVRGVSARRVIHSSKNKKEGFAF